jgi:ADP-heptose:LPS heptosyltransferase
MPPYDEQHAASTDPHRAMAEHGSNLRAPIRAPVAEAIIPFAAEGLLNDIMPGAPPPGELLEYECGPLASPVRRILVLKLDHFGDFVIGIPALRELRQTFPQAHIRLVCGTWNEQNAKDSGLVDEVRCCNYFPERSAGWNGDPVDNISVFEAAVRGRFDLAIDLRVDEDTRHLLARVDARLRCGIGSRSRFPLLDIAFPSERTHHAAINGRTGSTTFLAPAHFHSQLPVSTPLFHEGRILSLNGHPLIQGPLPLPVGELSVSIGLSMHGFRPGLRGCSVTVEITTEGGQVVHAQVFGRSSLGRLGRAPLILELDNQEASSRFEFRIRAAGRPWAGTLRFSGIHIARRPTTAPARFLPVELHTGETLALLIALIRQRTTDLYQPPAAAPRFRKRFTPQVVIAPFSNSTTRDWPVAHYARLVSLLLERSACEIVLVGTAAQLAASRRITEQNETSRLRNMIGRTSWSELSTLLRDTDLVVCNNSGIGHLAAALGTEVLAIYSGSHQPQEWGPRGPRSHAIMQPVACSPCGFERLEDCNHNHACMRMISPDAVLERVLDLLQGYGEAALPEMEARISQPAG